ncbi:PrsW family intramembrane metalloprotease [Halorubellus salinus]|uniref:PrsW family intramembrane metalloprotease n=1 Tax=Halorubellus salinus TaxID=755309 RepID=UPI001D08FADE|nr:PrsW family glutamic-type intramembrane protease [Halorubellus salinus]
MGPPDSDDGSGEGARDPVTDGGYEVSTWEPRTALDRLAVAVYSGIVASARWAVVALAVLAFTAQLGLVVFGITVRPTLGVLTLASILPALVIVGVIWYQNPTMREPVWPLAATFLLSILLASFAALANSALKSVVTAYVPSVLALVVFFFLVVGPVEETVKWLAVRLYAYRSAAFDAVIDGAVYGAVAGLGFATIENALYISRAVIDAGGFQAAQSLQGAFEVATSRSFVGPGHVLYSAISGYYLGLAKFSDDHWGPIVVKGLLIAAGIHATYNSIVTLVDFGAFPLVDGGVGFVLFVFAFEGAVGYVLYRKLSKYNRYYRAGATQANAD